MIPFIEIENNGEQEDWGGGKSDEFNFGLKFETPVRKASSV